MAFKVCSKCKTEKPEEVFYTSKSHKDGRYPSCKECNKPSKKKYRESHKQYYNEKVKKFGKTDKGFYNKYKSAAKKRNIEFNLTLDQFVTFSNANCFYCGDKLDGIRLDRIDNSVGYTISNVIPCCTFCNRMKYIHSQEDFILQCLKIADLHGWFSLKSTLENVK